MQTIQKINQRDAFGRRTQSLTTTQHIALRNQRFNDLGARGWCTQALRFHLAQSFIVVDFIPRIQIDVGRRFHCFQQAGFGESFGWARSIIFHADIDGLATCGGARIHTQFLQLLGLGWASVY